VSLSSTRPWRAAAALALLSWAACACREVPAGDAHQGAGRGTGRTLRIRDAAGKEHRFALPLRRIVSLVPSATETLRALGTADRVVGRTDFDTAAWVEAIPSVGGGLHPSIEAIAALRPDVVIRFAGTQDPATPARLDDLGIPDFAVRPDRIEDVLHIIHQMGALTGARAAAESLVAAIEAGLDSIRASAADLPPVRVAYVLGGDPPWVAGPGTYIDDLITVAGGVNAFADLSALYSAVSPEEFVSRRIDAILMHAGSDFDRRLARGRPVLLVGAAVEIPGPSVVAAARDIARLLRSVSR